MNGELADIKGVAAFSGERLFFELDNGLYASVSALSDNDKVLLFPWKEIFLEYLYDEDIPAPTEEQLAIAESNYRKYGADARMFIID